MRDVVEAAVPADGTRPRGRTDRRQAILDAAFAVFARQGYEHAGVREVAAEAGVAKPTVYNHFADKESLFRHAVEAAADAVNADCLAVVDELRTPGDDLDAAMRDVAYRLLLLCCDERSGALRRLAYAQLVHFPDLMQAVYARTSIRIRDAVADRLARLCLDGRLRGCEPTLAAEQFMALLTGPMEARTRMGSRKAPKAEVRDVAYAAVDTFMRAYAVNSPA